MSAWASTNGAPAKTGKHTVKDVDAYFKINDVKKLVQCAVNILAVDRPADFKASLSATLLKQDLLTLPNSKKPATKQEAQAASDYFAANHGEAILSAALSRLAVNMPPNPQAVLAEYVRDAPTPTVTPPAAPAAAASAAAASKPAEAVKETPPKSTPTPSAASAAPPPAVSPPAAVPADKAKAKEEVPAGVDAKKWKVAVKEGGKKGVELAGCADMGGLEFFTTQIESAEGDLALLQAAMDAANKDVDPADEEAKGGSGMVGKMLLSSGDKQLGLICYVPKDKVSKVKASEWMAAVLAPCKGEVVESNAELAKGRVVSDGKERFALKDKDTCQAASVAWLKERGLFPQADDDDDDWVPPEDSGVEW